MRDCCAAHQFSGCCAGIGCTSATVPLIELGDRLDGAARARRAMGDKLIAGTLAVVAVGAAFLSFAFVCVPEMQRWAKDHQEQFAVLEASR